MGCGFSTFIFTLIALGRFAVSTKGILLFMLLLLAPFTCVLGQAPDPNQSAAKHVAVPSGTSFWTVMERGIAAKKANVGDAVKLKLVSDLSLGEVVVPKRAVLIAQIQELRRPDEADGRTKIGIVLQRAEWDELSAEFNAGVVEGYYPGEAPIGSGLSDMGAFRTNKARETGARTSYGLSIGFDMPVELRSKMGEGAFPAPIENSKSGGGALIVVDDKGAMKRGWPSGRIVEGTAIRFESNAPAKAQK
jgi:hypothetical protein